MKLSIFKSAIYACFDEEVKKCIWGVEKKEGCGDAEDGGEKQILRDEPLGSRFLIGFVSQHTL
jgi:hypothetical protein